MRVHGRTALLTVLAAFLLLTGCGSRTLEMETVTGVWCYGYVDDWTFQEFCALHGAEPEAAQTYWTVTEETVVSENALGSGTFTVTPAVGGFNLEGTNGEGVIGVLYDEQADTLSYQVLVPGGEEGEVTTYSFVRCPES